MSVVARAFLSAEVKTLFVLPALDRTILNYLH
jgi:hypothetical protein